ncbi:MAG: hypothetical protein IID46_11375 [Planctomycetes bacterium]|nr:hypothetical protein [Planctomycetota bacterium]
MDHRLLGTWTKVKGDWGNDVITIGNKKGTKNTLEFIYIDLDEDDTAIVKRLTVYARRGKIDLLSIEDEGKEGKKFYMLCKYEFSDPNTLHLILPDPQTVGEAVFRGELKGEAKSIGEADVSPSEDKKGEIDSKKEIKSKDESKEPGSYDIVALTDSPKQIIEYLEKNASKCFKHKTVYKRIGEQVE